MISMEIVKIPKDEYEKLKMQANIDVELLQQLVKSLKDIKSGRVIKTR